MALRVALLRGINVGGANRLPMAELRRLCEGLGWHDVQSCVASGNLVFDAEGEGDALAATLQQALAGERGLEVPVLVLPPATLRRALADCPFAPDDPRQVHAGFPFGPPAPDRALFDRHAAKGDGFETGEGVVWLYTPGGFGRSKLAERFERLAGVPLTARNLKTVAALVEMLDARGNGC